MARPGDSSVWISRNQSSVLRGAHRATTRKGLAIAETRDLPFGEWLFSGGHPRRAKHRYDYGIHATRRANDGNAFRFCGPRDNDLLDATRWLHGTATRRGTQHEIRPAGNLRDLGGHAPNRCRHERRPYACLAGVTGLHT